MFGGIDVKPTIFVVIVTLAATPLWASGGDEAAESRALSLAHVFATDHPVHRGALHAQALLEERTDGALTLQIYPNGTYSGYDDAVRGVQSGVLDVAPLDSAVDYYPPSGVLLGPYTFRDYDHWLAFKRSEIAAELRETISETVGVKFLAFFQFGFRHATANVPARTPEDFADLRLRVVDFAPYPEVATVLGARPVAMPIGDVYMALNTNVADGQENPFTQILTMKFFEVQEYLILTGHMMATTGMAMSEQAWNGLTAEQRIIVQEVFSEMAAFIDEIVIGEAGAMLDELEARGMEVIEVDIGPFQERVPLVLEKYPQWEDLYYEIQAVE